MSRREPELLFRSSWRRRVAEAVYDVVEDFVREGITKFTVRQIFYQLVSRGILESTRKDYKNFDKVMVMLREEDPRLDSMIVDDSREVIEDYNPRFWVGQRNYTEVWLEKLALKTVVRDVTRRFRVNLVICRGYPSVTILRRAKELNLPNNTRYIILYLGDFDPSGEDIFRWINEELEPFNIVVRKVALTRQQVITYRLPPRVPKRDDPRTPSFVERYGEVAVELDALHPRVLRDILRRELLKYIDVEVMVDAEVEEAIKTEAKSIVDEILKPLRKQLLTITEENIRREVLAKLPILKPEMKARLRAGHELTITNLYRRERIQQHVTEALVKLLSKPSK